MSRLTFENAHIQATFLKVISSGKQNFMTLYQHNQWVKPMNINKNTLSNSDLGTCNPVPHGPRVFRKMAMGYDGSGMNHRVHSGLLDETSLFRWTLKLLILGSSDPCNLPDDQVHMDYCTMGFVEGHFIAILRGFFRRWISL